MSDWESGLCACFSDVSSCLSASFCGLCDVAIQYAGVEDREYSIVDCLISYFCFPFFACFVRNKMREKYNIDGSCLGDILVVWCCACCAIAQQSRELKHKGVGKASCF